MICLRLHSLLAAEVRMQRGATLHTPEGHSRVVTEPLSTPGVDGGGGMRAKAVRV